MGQILGKPILPKDVHNCLIVHSSSFLNGFFSISKEKCAIRNGIDDNIISMNFVEDIVVLEVT